MSRLQICIETRSVTRALLFGFLILLAATGGAEAQVPLSPDERAARLVRQMRLDEKIQLVHTRAGARDPHDPPPRGPNDDVGYAPPITRLGIPALHIDDGSLGVANAWDRRDGDEATALPSGLALAASWDPALAYEAGAVAGDEPARVRIPHSGPRKIERFRWSRVASPMWCVPKDDHTDWILAEPRCSRKLL